MKVLKTTFLLALCVLMACATQKTKLTDTSPVNTPASEPEPAAESISLTPMPKTTLPIDERVRMGTLDNGMKYYIQQNNKPENRAELRLAVAAGSMQEDEDQLGLAHFVEHMAFNGSTNFKKNELSLLKDIIYYSN